MRAPLLVAFCFALFCAASGMESSAADLGAVAYAPPAAAGSFLSEIRGGALAHNPGGREAGSVDISIEALTVKPFTSTDPLVSFLIPKLHLGASINTAGDTSQVYAGFTWSYDITERVFLEASFGGAIHNGKTGDFVPRERESLGCTALFRESASLGYRIDRNWSVMATVEHVSNAKLCNANQGLTNYGVRLGYSF